MAPLKHQVKFGGTGASGLMTALKLGTTVDVKEAYVPAGTSARARRD